jgi:hypothetical protein
MCETKLPDYHVSTYQFTVCTNCAKTETFPDTFSYAVFYTTEAPTLIRQIHTYASLKIISTFQPFPVNHMDQRVGTKVFTRDDAFKPELFFDKPLKLGTREEIEHSKEFIKINLIFR